MKPLFFGSSERQLFGVYQPPAALGPNNQRAVLLCYPGVQEYNTNHWAFRRLAANLTRQGYHVFRFDYFGTGDSAGSVAEGHPDIWVENVGQAASELLDVSAARSLSLVGMRLGGALAFLATQGPPSVSDLVLWEPVVDGREYLHELERWHRSRSLLLLHAARARKSNTDLLGYPLPAELRRSLESIDLCRACNAERPRAGRVHVVAAEARPEYTRLCDALTAAGHATRLRVVSEALAGASSAPRDKAALSNDILVAITEQLGQTRAA
jgi:pimeloyl-ACP methyl ester carboxylesterase